MTIIDNIELDTDNKDFNYAVELVKNGNKLIYLTGKAGTGKTTFLKYIKSLLGENIVVLAPTGVAAINAGGQTIHSFFKVSPSVYVPNDKRLRVKSEINDTDKSTIYDHFKLDKEKVQLINKMEILIIDEISMVRCDLLDVIDKLLRVYRKKPNEIFGGLQIILIGDTFQLPPIADYEQWEILRMFYASPYFFSSQVITNNKPIFIELKKIYRQKEQEFIDLLNKIRVNQMDSEDLQKLNQRYNPNVDFSDKLNQIILATTNKIVNDTNQKKLTELAGEQKSFEASVEGIFPESIYPTEKTLSLKVGAQIMFIKNDFSKNIFNGKLGKVKSFSENRIVVTGFDNFNEFEISVETNTWKNIRYKWDDTERKIIEEIIGTFTQIPLKLAWAITVHKSQGLTFDNVIADFS
jgi:ATP-dependent exoDNAse (exonuclease V) alpha subunit